MRKVISTFILTPRDLEVKKKGKKSFFQKTLDKPLSLWYNTAVPIANLVRWCGSMAEQLICNQQVDGSTPFTSSKPKSTHVDFYMGDFPSGQRGQTVNLLSHDFGGPNPPSPTSKKGIAKRLCPFCCRRIERWIRKPAPTCNGGPSIRWMLGEGVGLCRCLHWPRERGRERREGKGHSQKAMPFLLWEN